MVGVEVVEKAVHKMPPNGETLMVNQRATACGTIAAEGRDSALQPVAYRPVVG